MRNKNNLSYLKEQYLSKIQPLKSVDQLIDDIKNKLNIFEINENDLNDIEKPHFTFLRLNYHKKYNFDVQSANFRFYIIKKDESSMRYYNCMRNEKERVIVVTESNANLITSTCTVLSLELRIKRGLDVNKIEDDNIEFIEYLTHFDLLDQLKKMI